MSAGTSLQNITVVVAFARNRVIGNRGELPWHLPEDLRRFKAITMGGVLLMGRKTYDSIGRPLPGRDTVILSRNPGYSAEHCRVFGGIEAALAHCTTLNKEIFIVGGAELYRQTLALASRLCLTQLLQDFPGDTYFPEVNTQDYTLIAEQEVHNTSIAHRYSEYRRR